MKADLTAALKIGGSLSRDEALASLCAEIPRLASQHRLLIIPGGGEFADLVRKHDMRFQLGGTTAHRMAILAMDQYGYLLGDLIPGARLVTGLAAARQEAARGGTPILIPSNLLLQADPLPHSWQVTSDSIAAWVAGELQVPLLILLKDVDGLYSADPKSDETSELLLQIEIEELPPHPGGLDAYLPVILAKHKLKTWVINGRRPQRLADLLHTGHTLGTCIYPKRV